MRLGTAVIHLVVGRFSCAGRDCSERVEGVTSVVDVDVSR
jgi:hypothetical protein